METFEVLFFEQLKIYWLQKKSNKKLRRIKEKLIVFFNEAEMDVVGIEFLITNGKLTSIEVTFQWETCLEEKDGRLGVEYSTSSYMF